MRYLLLLLFFVAAVSATAQVCSPDPAYTQAGIYPDSATGIPPAQEGSPYELIATVVSPTDTLAIVLPGTPAQVVLIDSIVLDTLLGLPAWASYTCEPNGCAFPGGVPGCIFISGTPGPGEAGKSYTIGFVTRSYGRLQLLPAIQLPAQIDTTGNYYNLIVEPGTGVDQVSASSQVYPNPASDILNLSADGYFSFVITDVAGRQVLAGEGNRWLALPIQQWATGVYFVSMTMDNGVPVTRKVVVQ